MKYILISLLIGVLNTCVKAKKDIPSCIQEKIDKIKSQQKWNPSAEVNEYIYKEKRVFLFNSDCCDQYNMVYDEDCNPVCAASGGIDGSGDRKCLDFEKEAKHIKLVWKDERE